MPMVVNDKSTAPIEGYLIYFNDNLDKVCVDEEKWIYRLYDAYKYIDYTKPDKLFKWKTIEHNGIKFNMTLGKNRDYGVSYKSNKGNYDGGNDPNFYELINNKYILNEIYNMTFIDSFDRSCKLQMLYMLLWSCIDKYMSLCYGGWFQHDNVVKWSRWQEFQLGFNKATIMPDSVDAVNNNKTYELTPGDPESSIEYYYQLRCNIVHNIRKEHTNYKPVLNALHQLLKIFDTTLDVSFNPENYEDYHLSNWKELLKENTE